MQNYPWRHLANIRAGLLEDGSCQISTEMLEDIWTIYGPAGFVQLGLSLAQAVEAQLAAKES